MFFNLKAEPLASRNLKIKHVSSIVTLLYILYTSKTFPFGLRLIFVPGCGSTVLANRARGTLSRHMSTTMTSSPSLAATPQLHDTEAHTKVRTCTCFEERTRD